MEREYVCILFDNEEQNWLVFIEFEISLEKNVFSRTDCRFSIDNEESEVNINKTKI